jgi:2'-5' RNA ligase
MCEFAGGLTPFRVRLDNKVEYPDAYFRSLHLTAHETPELMDVFSSVRERFVSIGEAYFPHLSLAYSGFNLQTKRKMAQELGDVPEIEFEVRRLTLFNASPELPVSSWKMIEQFPFGGTL